MPNTKTEPDQDLVTLERALLRAEHKGYKIPLLEYLLFVQDRPPSLTTSLKIWAKGLIFSTDFASALFGTERVDDNGYDMNTISLWAKQVFVEHAGELHAVPDDGRNRISFATLPEIDWDKEPVTPTELVNGEIVTYDLKKLAAAIPFRTHRVEELEVQGGAPAYIFHLKNMVVCANPFEYLKEYIDKEEKSERKTNKTTRSTGRKSNKPKKDNRVS
jgi:hypothetical protein